MGKRFYAEKEPYGICGAIDGSILRYEISITTQEKMDATFKKYIIGNTKLTYLLPIKEEGKYKQKYSLIRGDICMYLSYIAKEKI